MSSKNKPEIEGSDEQLNEKQLEHVTGGATASQSKVRNRQPPPPGGDDDLKDLEVER